jgi:hypothetical protein
MNIPRTDGWGRFVYTLRQSATQGAEAGARRLPEYLYDQSCELSQQVGIPRISCPQAWYDDHRVLWMTATLAGTVGGGLAGLVAGLEKSTRPFST